MLCRYGSIYGQAAKVMVVCEKAVALAPQEWNVRDSRALARALTGHISGAIEDLLKNLMMKNLKSKGKVGLTCCNGVKNHLRRGC